MLHYSRIHSIYSLLKIVISMNIVINNLNNKRLAKIYNSGLRCVYKNSHPLTI